LHATLSLSLFSAVRFEKRKKKTKKKFLQVKKRYEKKKRKEIVVGSFFVVGSGIKFRRAFVKTYDVFVDKERSKHIVSWFGSKYAKKKKKKTKKKKESSRKKYNNVFLASRHTNSSILSHSILTHFRKEYVEQLGTEKHEEWEWVGKVSKGKRVVLVGRNRVYWLTAGKGKVEKSGHYLELTAIVSKKPDSVEFQFKSFKETVQLADGVDDVIHAVRMCYNATFGSLPKSLKPKEDVSPSSRLHELPPGGSGACGGYAATYGSVCDYLGVQMRPDIEWDINNVLAANNVTEFNIKEFEQPMRPEDQRALMVALGYNEHFVSFTCRRFKLHRDSFGALAQMFERNKCLETLVLKAVGMSKDAFVPVCQAIAGNADCALTSIVVSSNSLSDAAFGALGTAIGSLKRGLVVLDVSANNSKAGVAALMGGLRKNIHMTATLSTLDVSQNVLGSSGASALAQWLANPNGLQRLNLSNTQANLDTVIAGVMRGCQELQHLDVSGNKITKKEAATLVRFVQGAAKLKHLDISDSQIPPESFKDVVDACSGNYYLQDFELVARRNKFGAQGARLIGQALGTSKNVARVDIGENDFGDDGVLAIAKALVKNESLKHLGLGGNFSSGGGRQREDALEAIIDLLASECPITSLDVSGTSRAQLKGDISTLLYAIGTDDKLEYIDVSSNAMGDKGALAFSKALQTNRKLASAIIDDNGITYSGFQSLSYGLKRNLTLKHMPLPITDITSAMPRDTEGRVALEKIVREIDAFVKRNQSPQSKFSKAQTSGMGAANMLLASGEREQLERLRFKIKATGRTLDDEDALVLEDVDGNDNHIQSIHSLQEQHHLAASDAIMETMRGFVPQLVPVVERHQAQLVDEMMSFVDSRYRSIDSDTVNRLRRNIQFGGKEMDVGAVEQVIVDAAASEINNRIQECFISAVEICTDYLYEKLGESLQYILEDVKVGGDDDDSSGSEYEEIEVEVTDSDQSDYSDDDDGDYGDGDDTDSSSVSTADMSVPPIDADAEGPAPPRPTRSDSGTDLTKLPSGVPPGLPAGTAPRPSRPPRGAGPPGRPVRPGSLGGGTPPPGSPVRGRGGLRGRGGPGRGRGGAGAVGGGIAARLEAMGGGIPMMGMMGGGPPPRVAPRGGGAPSPGRPTRPPSANSPAPPVASRPARPAPTPTSTPTKTGGGGGGGLFKRGGAKDKKKKTKIIRRKVKKTKGRNTPVRGANIKVDAPSGRNDNVEQIETVRSTITTHATRDRPMIQRKRRPPTRRPRNELLSA
jgi:leucine-rich repeat-containing protein 16